MPGGAFYPGSKQLGSTRNLPGAYLANQYQGPPFWPAPTSAEPRITFEGLTPFPFTPYLSRPLTFPKLPVGTPPALVNPPVPLSVRPSKFLVLDLDINRPNLKFFPPGVGLTVKDVQARRLPAAVPLGTEDRIEILAHDISVGFNYKAKVGPLGVDVGKPHLIVSIPQAVYFLGQANVDKILALPFGATVSRPDLLSVDDDPLTAAILFPGLIDEPASASLPEPIASGKPSGLPFQGSTLASPLGSGKGTAAATGKGLAGDPGATGKPGLGFAGLAGKPTDC